jgi:hypothetical protein
VKRRWSDRRGWPAVVGADLETVLHVFAPARATGCQDQQQHRDKMFYILHLLLSFLVVPVFKGFGSKLRFEHGLCSVNAYMNSSYISFIAVAIKHNLFWHLLCLIV